MILLTVIAVGLLSLSSISLRSTGQTAAMSSARANARLALMLAIGELQKNAGPDTRVTARADILDKDNAPLLGAWKSWEGTDHETSGAVAGRPISPGDYKSKKSDRFLGWLVSGDPTNLNSSDKLPPTDASASRIALIGENTLGSDQTKLQVNLDPVFVNSKKGAYAWWVGGENQKARLPQPDVSKTTKSPADWANKMKSDSSADPKALGMESLLTDPDSAAKAVTLKQTDLISQSGNQKASREHFFDLSTVSTGLLTNTATGGWRKDLSLFTERYDDLPASDLPLFRLTPEEDSSQGRATSQQPLAANSLLYPWSGYRSGSKPADKAGAVASWANLTDYALSYRKFNSSGSLDLQSRPIADMADNYKYLHQVQQMPIVARMQLVFSYYARQANTGSDGILKISVGIMINPVITLWNPYNVTLKTVGDMYFTLGGSNGAPFPIAIKHTINDGNPNNINPYYNSLLSGSVNYPNKYVQGGKFIKFYIPADTISNMPPGATMVYSPIGGSGTNWQYPNAAPVKLGPGYHSTDGGFLFFFPQAGATADTAAQSYVPNSIAGSTKIEIDAKFDNGFTLKEDSSSAPTCGIRMIVRSDADLPNTDSQEIEYRMLIPQENVNKGTEHMVSSVSALQMKERADPFLSLVCGLRFGANSYASLGQPIASTTTFQPSKGVLQSSPLATYTATGGLDAADPSIKKAYLGTRSPVNSSLDYSFVKHTGVGGFTPNIGDGNCGYIMSGFQTGDGLKRYIAAELPASPLASLGDLQNWDMRFGNPIPPFAYNVIGNSDASPLLPPTAVVNNGDASNLQHDDSYCANHLLFDDWFFSSIAGGQSGQFGGNQSRLKTCYTDFVKGDVPLVNRAYQPLAEDSTLVKQSGSAANSLFDEQVNQSDSWRKIAARLEVEGMFNVNSTSVAAWRALLGHARGQQVPYYNAGGSVLLGTKADYQVSRFSVAGDSLVGTSGSSGEFSAASAITGYQKLDGKMLDDLAQEIVNQVRKRGPFLSLSEFVNRQLSSDKELAVAGAIQAALNQLEKSSNLNKDAAGSFSADNKYSSDKVSNAEYQFKEAATGIAIYGAPGWVRQADLLSPLAPILSARDDTFVIRAYGDARDANNKVIAKATCEVTVRRTRNYCDSTDAADFVDPPTSAMNRTFGRKFEIVLFRWLSTSEI